MGGGGKPSHSKGFTLAEILITLGIIGVVAAMTLPSIINRTQSKELQTQFKKAYSELNQASRMFYNDYGISVAEYAASNSNNYSSALFKYFKGAKVLSDWDWSDQDETGGNSSTTLYAIYTMTGSTRTNGYCDNGGFTSDVSGKMYLFNDPPASGKNGPVICVDINGKKGPNRFGFDYFLFVFTTDGFVIPMGQTHPNNQNSNSLTNTNTFVTGSEFCRPTDNYRYQATCSYYAIADKNPQGNGSYWQDFLGKNR